MSKLLQYPDIKQPWEQYYLGFDFSALLPTSDSIEVENVTLLSFKNQIAVLDLIDLTTIQVVGDIVYYKVIDCPSGSYKITCRVTTSQNNKYEVDAILKVVNL